MKMPLKFGTNLKLKIVILLIKKMMSLEEIMQKIMHN
jgi:hypothetical protein